MATPGSNLLRQAMRVIKPLPIEYKKYRERELNDFGSWVTSYDDPVVIKASVQAIDRSRYERMGLDFSKNYVMIYTSHDIGAVVRDKTPDQFILPNGRTYTAVNVTDWYGLDGQWVTGKPGWSGVMAVEGPAEAMPSQPEPQQ